MTDENYDKTNSFVDHSLVPSRLPSQIPIFATKVESTMALFLKTIEP
jgi:hypothetical protein